MKKTPLLACAGFGGALAALSIGATSMPAPAIALGNDATFEVTVTNLTRNQVFSPVLVASHGPEAAFFVPGEPASAPLGTLAETGDNGPLMFALESNQAVADVGSGLGPIPPGASEAITIQTSAGAGLLSLASMLVNTNDSFVALDGFPLPTGRRASTFAIAFDAGTEFNSESCDYVPGPACGGTLHDPTPAEGYVYVSNGIHGIAGLASEIYDWHNPVAEIVIRRLPKR